MINTNLQIALAHQKHQVIALFTFEKKIYYLLKILYLQKKISFLSLANLTTEHWNVKMMELSS